MNDQVDHGDDQADHDGKLCTRTGSSCPRRIKVIPISGIRMILHLCLLNTYILLRDQLDQISVMLVIKLILLDVYRTLSGLRLRSTVARRCFYSASTQRL